MSETLLPEDKAAPAVADARDTVATPTSPAPRRGNGLVLLALLVGVAGLAAGGWGVWQIRSIEAHHQLQVSDVKKDLDDATSTLRDENRKLADRLNGLPAAEELENRRRLITQLQGDQQHLSQRLESVLGASRKDWRLAEAEHLLRLASLRLSALQDINSAQSLVQGADDILREQDDPSAFAAREQLAKTLQALRGTNQPDRTGLFLQLGALREQVTQLNTLAPVYQDNGEALFGLKGDPDSRLSQWWAHISRYFRIDFDADKSVRPLLAGESLAQVRLALSLALEQAQWAALNGEQAVYTQALKSSREVLDGNFNADNPQGRAIRERIDALSSAPVTVVTPDLAASLSAVQAYLNQRHAPSEALKPGEAGKADGLEAPAP